MSTLARNLRPPKPCKDCGSTTRKLTPPGPRCATCHRARKKVTKASTHENYVGKTYGLKPEEYARILELQSGRCYLCRRATGATKKLAVDHDHACCPETPTCGRCTRGLLCGPCNKIMGHARDDQEFFERGKQYLRLPPARIVIWERGPDG